MPPVYICGSLCRRRTERRTERPTRFVKTLLSSKPFLPLALQAAGYKAPLHVYGALCDCHASAHDPVGVWYTINVRARGVLVSVSMPCDRPLCRSPFWSAAALSQAVTRGKGRGGDAVARCCTRCHLFVRRAAGAANVPHHSTASAQSMHHPEGPSSVAKRQTKHGFSLLYQLDFIMAALFRAAGGGAGGHEAASAVLCRIATGVCAKLQLHSSFQGELPSLLSFLLKMVGIIHTSHDLSMVVYRNVVQCECAMHQCSGGGAGMGTAGSEGIMLVLSNAALHEHILTPDYILWFRSSTRTCQSLCR